MTKQKIKLLLRISISIAILGVLLWKIGPSRISAAFIHFKGSAFALINVTTAFAFLLAGLGVLVLGRTMSERLPWVRGIKGFLATLSFSLFIPGRVGDLGLLFYWKDFMSYEECFAVVLLDKVITIWWVLLLGSVGIYVIFENRVGFMLLLSGALAMPAFLLIVRGNKPRKLLSRVVPERIAPKFHAVMNALRLMLRGGRKSLFTAVAISGTRILTYGLGFWILMQGFSIQCPFSYALFVIVLAQFTSLIPISIMGLGTAEAVAIYCLSRLHIDPGAVIAAQFVGRLVYIAWLFLFFLLFSLKEKQELATEGSLD